MAEAVASRVEAARDGVRFWRRSIRVAPCEGDERHQDVKDFERLIEELLRKAEWMDRQLSEKTRQLEKVTAERDYLSDEVKRLTGE